MEDADEDPFERAAAAHAAGRFDEAAAGYESCLRRDGDDAVAMSLLGAVRVAQGDLAEGVALLERSIALDPDSATAWLHLGIARDAVGNVAEAVEALHEAERLGPELAEVHGPLARCLARLGRHEEAILRADRVPLADPAAIEAGLAAADSLHSLGRSAEAEARLRQLLEAHPGSEPLLARLGSMLESDPDPIRRLEGLHATTLARRGDPDAVARLAVELGKAGRLEECVMCWRDVEALRPDSSEPPFQVGRALAVLGRREQAMDAFRRALARDPRRADVWLAVSSIHRFREGDPETDVLREVSTHLANRSEEDRCWLHYAVAKMHEDLGDHESAFDHHAAGAALMRRKSPSDLAAELHLMEVVRESVPAERWGMPDAGTPLGERCILVVGMPRSGTTLVEQILSSHSLVHGAGELPAASEAANEIGLAAILAAAADRHDREILQRFGEAYLRRLPIPEPPRRLVCDKQPQNFRLLGLLALALPHARFVHVRRDPRDVGLSCFQAMFGSQAWSFELREIGAYLRGYRDLMAHWDRCLGDRIVTVRYELLVGDPDAEIRRLLARLELPFEERCLRPNETERAVNTASLAQVRRPITASSVGRWRRYERRLAPLLDELGDVSDF